MRTVIFINAGSRQTRRIRHRIRTDLRETQLDVVKTIAVGSYRRFRTGLDLLRRERDVGCVIIAGGDGTIAGVINTVRERHVRIGILPCGTGNSFARSLGIPLDYDDALAVIAAGHVRRPAIGTVNGQVFVNAAAIGLSAATARRISDRTKRYFGRAAYFLSGARQLFAHRAFECTLATPAKTYRIKTHELLIANGTFHGAKPVDRHTSAFRDYLTFVALGTDSSRWRYVRSQWYLLRGRQLTEPKLFTVRCKSAVVTTEPRRLVHADGEVIARTPAEFSVIAKAITVFTPRL